MVKEKKFDYGIAVKVKITSPTKYFPGAIGDICGMSQVITNKEAQYYLCSEGDWVYTVEFVDGASIEIPECYLETDPNRLKYRLKDQIIMKKDIPADYHPSEIMSVTNYHIIIEETLAKKFKLKRGDIIYVLKNKNGEEVLAPEYFIEKKLNT